MQITRWFGRLILILAMALPLLPGAEAQRLPVLQQIEVPHDYYFREMYLPQVSSGPQSPTWSPDGRALIYSMQGSLWRQDLDSTTAVQLTAGPGYDHQPDWSPDGQTVLFTRYHDDAMELQLLHRDAGQRSPERLAIEQGTAQCHPALLLQCCRSCDQPGVVTWRRRTAVRCQPGDTLWNRRYLVSPAG